MTVLAKFICSILYDLLRKVRVVRKKISKDNYRS